MFDNVGDRQELLARLTASSGSPDLTGVILVLPSVEEMQRRDSEGAAIFAQRRSALFRELLDLRDRRSSYLGAEEMARMLILEALFDPGEASVDDCWQSYVAVRGTELEAYNQAVNNIRRSGCVHFKKTP